MNKVLTVQEVAKLLNVSESTVKYQMRKGNLKGKKITPGKWSIFKEDFEEYLGKSGLSLEDLK